MASAQLTPFSEIPSRAWFVLGVGMCCGMISLMPSTSVNVAIPQITTTLGMNPILGQWISTIWLAGTTVSMLMAEWLITHFGYRNSLVMCLVLVLLSSMGSALATSGEMLIFMRAVQGLGAGPIPSLVMLSIFEFFPLDRRGFAGGVLGSGIILAPTFGPVMAGWFVTELDWRWSFFALVPMIMVCIPLVLRFFPSSKGYAEKKPMDWWAIALIGVAIFSIMFTMTYGPILGWKSMTVSLYFFSFLIATALFIRRQFTAKYPLLNMRIFRNVQFAIGCLLTLVLGLGLYGSSFFLPLFLQSHQSWEAFASGMLFIPAGIVMSFVFPFGGMLTDRFDARIVLIPGLLIFTFSMYMLTNLGIETTALYVVTSVIISRIGLGLIMPALTVATMSPLPPQYMSQASGMSNFTRQLGGGMGLNFLAVYWMQLAVIRADYDSDAVNWANDAAYHSYESGTFFNWLNGYPWAVAESLAQSQMAGTMKMWSLIFGYRDIFTFNVIILVASLSLAFFISPRYKYEMPKGPAAKPPDTNSEATNKVASQDSKLKE